MSAYLLSDAARDDLLAIWDYLAEEAGSAIADRMMADLEAAMRKLARAPGLGHRREDLTDQPVRFWLVHSYLIIYADKSKPLAIARVLHASRDVRALLGLE